MPSRATKHRKKLVIEWFENGGLVCGICWQPIENVNKLTVDHIIPRAKGGHSNQENLQPAHKKCNSEKGDKLLHITPETKKNFLNTLTKKETT